MVGHLTVLLGFVTALAVRCDAFEVPAYRIGEIATNDVITARRMLVVDEQATAEIREKEARKIGLFAVYSTNHAAYVERNVRLAVDRMREDFLQRLRVRYGTDRLTPEVIDGRSFGDIANQFQVTNPDPPVTRETLTRWAAGETRQDFLEEWCDPLREVLRSPICPVKFPAGMGAGGNRRVHLLMVDDLRTYVKEESALSNSVRFFATNLVPLSVAREQLRQSYPRDRGSVASYLSTQLEPNCRFDTNLTQRVRNLAVSGLVQMKQFEPGEVVVRQGQIIDARALAALAELRERATVADLEKKVAVNNISVQLLSERNIWLGGLLGVAILVLLLVIIRSHRKRPQALLPVLSASMIHESAEDGLDAPTVVHALPEEDGHWRRRALESEWQAARAKDLARSKLMPHLAQHLKDNVVQQMARQMDDLLEVQTAVAEQMSEFEARLGEVHAPLHERLRMYEQRIADLNMELSQRGEENQVLLRARIQALQRQLEIEKAGAQAAGRPS